MKSYRMGFTLALIANIALAAILAGIWFGIGPFKRWTRTQVQQEPVPIHESPAKEASEAATAEAQLVPIQISPQRMQSIGVKTGLVELKAVDDEIRATGSIAADESRLSYVQVRLSGYVQKVSVNATYQYVKQGDPLFTIYSPDAVAMEREYLVARQNQQRMSQSAVAGVSESATALVNAALDRLRQSGVPQEEINRLQTTGQIQQDLQITSPSSGYIVERTALPSVFIQPETRLFTLSDLSTVWVLADVFQSDLARIKPGDRATLTIDTYPGRTFEGRVDFIYPQVDMTTRTARARLVFPNPDLKLLPGMFAAVTFKLAMGKQLVIPANGVLQSGTRQIAFVEREDGYLEPREVELGERAGDEFVVQKGLKAGEHIVTSANFLVDSESQLQAALGSFVPPPGASATGAMPGTMDGPQTSIVFSSEPDPPHKGSNVFRVKLADEKGAAVSGADVAVTFSMAAMPQMGMAAMRVDISLSDKGNGLYEGTGALGSGGTWQVTIVARRGGEVIGSKQISVMAEGGM